MKQRNNSCKCFIFCYALHLIVTNGEFSCDWGSVENDGRPYIRDQCQMVETIGLERQYFKFYCDTKKQVGIVGYYDTDDDTCSGIQVFAEEAYSYQCTWNATVSDSCTPFYLSYSNYYSTRQCEGTIAQNFSLILNVIEGCRDIGGGASVNYKFETDPKMIVETWDISPNCDSNSKYISEEYYSGCHKLTSQFADGLSRISITYNQSNSSLVEW